jgi:chromosome segregation protein
MPKPAVRKLPTRLPVRNAPTQRLSQVNAPQNAPHRRRAKPVPRLRPAAMPRPRPWTPPRRASRRNWRQRRKRLRENAGRSARPLPRADRIEADVHRLRRQRDALGAVNLRAEEDAKTVQEEHDTLLHRERGPRGRDRQAAQRDRVAQQGRARAPADSLREVNTNFSKLFTHLFGGGEARLVLVESDDPLEAGLEILCQPPGKKLSTLSLLSGGEQTLTALALIFAVFLANPAPICVLDEVDAPLDDANVGRFCDLLDEMTRRTETRFLIITHHAVTMARMDRLFGVTMGEQGVSQLVSVDLKKAEAMVA